MTIQNSIWKINPQKPQLDFITGSFYKMDAIDLLNSIKNNSIDIVFLDPPFNLGKNYDLKIKDKQKESEYRIFLTQILFQSYEVLKPGGALYLYHIPKWSIEFASILKNIMSFQHWISISMKNGLIRGKGLYPAHYALLFFTKGKPKKLSRPKIPIAKCRHCNGIIKDYGGYKEYVKKGDKFKRCLG